MAKSIASSTSWFSFVPTQSKMMLLADLTLWFYTCLTAPPNSVIPAWIVVAIQISVWSPIWSPPVLWLPFLSRSAVETLVVTHFWTPRARDNVYLFRTKCKSVAHICWKIDKKWREKYLFIYFFRNPVWAVFCSLYPSPLLPKSSGFLRLTRGLHNAKFVPLLSCF